jgi:hypothetical protein
MRVGPSLDAIVAWAEKITELEQPRREQLSSQSPR